MLFLVACAAGCGYRYFPDHYLAHPREQPAEVLIWSDDVAAGELLIHILGARPPGEGPFPAVIVHPEGGKTANEMRGVIWDLAARGYAAVAADYERRIDGAYRRSLFAWRSDRDVTAIVDLAARYPWVDPQRVAALGFSQGGVFSLLIAAHAPDRIAAVVSYYPVTDFPRWLGTDRDGVLAPAAFGVVRWYFRRESGAATDAEFDRMLHAASPYYVAESIRAPVLLVHGARDTTAPLEESQRMADRLTELGAPVQLLIVPEGVHIFNFRQPREAESAWQATVDFLDQHLRSQPSSDRGRAATSGRPYTSPDQP